MKRGGPCQPLKFAENLQAITSILLYCAQVILMFSNIILKSLKLFGKIKAYQNTNFHLRTNMCICVRKWILNARMIWFVSSLTCSDPDSHLLLFLKPTLQLGVSQVGVHLLPIPAWPSPPGGHRPTTQLGPDPTLFEEQPAEACVPAGSVSVMRARCVPPVPKAVQPSYGCHHSR